MSASLYDALYGAEPDGSFAELRFRLRNGGMGREFVSVRDPERLAALVEARGGTTDTYIGVAPRVRQEGGRDAVERVHALFVDCDRAEALRALESFTPAPSIVMRSGDGRHAYWPLWPPLAPDWAERGNRRLAHALGADMRATDAARILRPPGTFNFKTGQPRPVELEHLEHLVYEARDVAGDLPDPAAVGSFNGSGRDLTRLEEYRDDPLLAIPASVYVELLTGNPVGRDGKARCPFHDDSTPSLHAWDDADKGWACFGCEPPLGRRHLGGTIIDFGARLYGIEPRGSGYHEVRQRLEAELIPALEGVAA